MRIFINASGPNKEAKHEFGDLKCPVDMAGGKVLALEISSTVVSIYCKYYSFTNVTRKLPKEYWIKAEGVQSRMA